MKLLACLPHPSLSLSLCSFRSLLMFYDTSLAYPGLAFQCQSHLRPQPGKPSQLTNQSLTNFRFHLYLCHAPSPASLSLQTIIREMNRLGMMVDLSHVSKGTMRDSLEVSEAPVIFSHSSAYELCNTSRNVQDDILQALARNGGLVMVNFYSKFLSCSDNSTVQDAVGKFNEWTEFIAFSFSLSFFGWGDYNNSLLARQLVRLKSISAAVFVASLASQWAVALTLPPLIALPLSQPVHYCLTAFALLFCSVLLLTRHQNDGRNHFLFRCLSHNSHWLAERVVRLWVEE